MKISNGEMFAKYVQRFIAIHSNAIIFIHRWFNSFILINWNVLPWREIDFEYVQHFHKNNNWEP